MKQILIDTIPSFIGAFLSGMVAIWIFYKGYKKQRQFDAQNALDSQIQVHLFFLYIVESCIDPLN